VVTDKGTIETEIVVNAAGQWGGEVGKMVGLNLPIVPMAHLYIITKPIKGVEHDFPTLRDPTCWSTGVRKSAGWSRVGMSVTRLRSA
jgi:glycine/D-amino acid oxidase-like deaminating enzyme